MGRPSLHRAGPLLKWARRLFHCVSPNRERENRRLGRLLPGSAFGIARRPEYPAELACLETGRPVVRI